MTAVDTLVDRYLHDLQAELRDLPAAHRQEILDEIGEHIGQARATMAAETEAAVRSLLERLGESRLWTVRDKLIGTLAGFSWILAGLGTVMAEAVHLPLSASGSGTPVGVPEVVQSSGPEGLAVILLLVPFVLPVAAAIYLAVRLRGRTGLAPVGTAR